LLVVLAVGVIEGSSSSLVVALFAGVSPEGTLGNVGDDGQPSTVFPLGRCLGDCDSSNECEGDLVCFQRDGGDPAPPGCVGSTEGATDYCVLPEDLLKNQPPIPAPAPVPSGDLAVVGDGGSPASVFPLGRCLGDCDRDSDCAGDLVCYQRSSSDDDVPGCDGSPEGSDDYCVRPEDMPSTLTNPGNDYDPQDAFPLERCQGDCDGDSGIYAFLIERGSIEHSNLTLLLTSSLLLCCKLTDCAGSLVCHQRSSYDPVPSCAGRGVRSSDYCIRPSDETAQPPVSGAFRLKLYWEPGYDW